MRETGTYQQASAEKRAEKRAPLRKSLWRNEKKESNVMYPASQEKHSLPTYLKRCLQGKDDKRETQRTSTEKIVSTIIASRCYVSNVKDPDAPYEEGNSQELQLHSLKLRCMRKKQRVRL